MVLPEVECSPFFGQLLRESTSTCSPTQTRSTTVGMVYGEGTRGDSVALPPSSVSSQAMIATRKKKQVTFPLDVLFGAAVREHDVEEVVGLVKTLAVFAPRTSSSETAVGPKLLLPFDLELRSRKGGLSALHLCCLAGRLDCVRVLASCGADLLARDNAGWSPLHVAAWAGHSEVVLFLLQHGGQMIVDCLSNDGRRAAEVARKESIAALLRKPLTTRLETAAHVVTEDRNDRSPKLSPVEDRCKTSFSCRTAPRINLHAARTSEVRLPMMAAVL